MWYNQGTIQVAANGTTATGTGTQFLGNVRVGDGIAIQGSASLHEVTGVTSNTQLTFSPPYAGTAGSGKAFRIVPVLGYDKDLSDAFNALRLQFGDQLSNLQPWATAPTQDAAQTALGMGAAGKAVAAAPTQDAAQTALGMSTSGKAVATGTPAQGRTALGLGTAATRDVGRSSGNLMEVGAFGLGGVSSPLPNFYPLSGIYEANRPMSGGIAPSWIPASSYTSYLALRGPQAILNHGLVFDVNRRTVFLTSDYPDDTDGIFSNPREIRHTGNTTADSNGFIKIASPIIKLHSDRMETEAEGTFERLGTGHYQLTGCNGLRLDDGWYIETPHDRNKNPYFNVEWEQDIEPNAEAGVLEEPADVTLTIRCYERVWNPKTGTYDNGDPVDIPDGRWIDLRMNEVRQPEPEEPEEPEDPEAPELQPEIPTEPSIPSVVTMAQAKLALLYAGLYEQVEQALADLPEPQKTAALIEWNHRQTLEREHPLVAQVAAALGLTEQQLDELFVDAAGR